MGWHGYGGFPRYVSVAERRRKAELKVAKLKKQGQRLQPVQIEGRTIAKTFWGKAWCENLEAYSDYANRLPRGRSYVRNGSVLDLQVNAGEINALVSGSELYKVKIAITPVVANKWQTLVKECSGKMGSLIELLQGQFSKGVMEIITHADKGLFPHPKEIKLSCSCPDWADMCKHVAAVLYGIGARLDQNPEDLFILRQANHLELVAQAGTAHLAAIDDQQTPTIDEDLSALFGIDIEQTPKKSTNSVEKKTKVPKSLTPVKSSRKTPARAPKKTHNNQKTLKTKTVLKMSAPKITAKQVKQPKKTQLKITKKKTMVPA